jgi:hypothetical protein
MGVEHDPLNVKILEKKEKQVSENFLFTKLKHLSFTSQDVMSIPDTYTVILLEELNHKNEDTILKNILERDMVRWVILTKDVSHPCLIKKHAILNTSGSVKLYIYKKKTTL